MQSTLPFTHSTMACIVTTSKSPKNLVFWASNDKVFSLPCHSRRISLLKSTKSIPQGFAFGTLAVPFSRNFCYGAK